MSIQMSLHRSLALITLVGAGLSVGAGSISAQPVAAPDRSADTAADPVLQRSETAEIVFGEIYVSDSNRIIFQTGRSPDESEADVSPLQMHRGISDAIDGTWTGSVRVISTIPPRPVRRHTCSPSLDSR